MRPNPPQTPPREQAERGHYSSTEAPDVRPVRDPVMMAKNDAGENFGQQPERQEPKRGRLEANTFADSEPREAARPQNHSHIDFGLREADQERAHQTGNRT